MKTNLFLSKNDSLSIKDLCILGHFCLVFPGFEFSCLPKSALVNLSILTLNQDSPIYLLCGPEDKRHCVYEIQSLRSVNGTTEDQPLTLFTLILKTQKVEALRPNLS